MKNKKILNNKFIVDKEFKTISKDSPFYTVFDSSGKRFLCKWTNNITDLAVDEYNAFVFDRWLGTNRMPEVFLVNEEFMERNVLPYSVGDMDRFCKALCPGTTISRTPILMEWVDGFPVGLRVAKKLKDVPWFNLEKAKLRVFNNLTLNSGNMHGLNYLVDEDNQRFIWLDCAGGLQMTSRLISTESKTDTKCRFFEKALYNLLDVGKNNAEAELLCFRTAELNNTEIGKTLDKMIVSKKFRTQYSKFLKRCGEIAQNIS